MSELELQRRQEYKKNRKKWITIQAIALCLLAVIALGSFLIYDIMDRTYYIEYSEVSSIDYKVQYGGNDFFEEEWIEKDQAYISSLINCISADFTYDMNMQASNVKFDYTYKIDAKMIVARKTTGKAFYTEEENLLPLTASSTRRSSAVSINETVLIDYIKYNDIASSIIKTYNLKNDASATLIVTLDVSVLSSGMQFEENKQNNYSVSLNIPLAVETFDIHLTQSAPSSESKVLAYAGAADTKVFKITGISASAFAAVLAIVLIFFIHITKNEDVNYVSKVRKILNAYSSFIQRIEGEFDEAGYQMVIIKTFNEMLGIRDTIQSPILMFENRDETMTRFLIPTNTKILYVYEIKVDNFDEIYAVRQEVEEEESIEEAVILETNASPEDIADAIAQPDIVLDEIEYVPDDDDEFAVAPEEDGVEVIGVVWPERQHKNKVYRYDPNGEELHQGDIVLVPTTDVAHNREVIRKAAVAHANHRVAPEHIKHPLKKIIGVIKHKISSALAPEVEETDSSTPKEQEMTDKEV